MTITIKFRRLSNCGEVQNEVIMDLKDATKSRLSKLFKLEKDSLFFTNESNQAIFYDSDSENPPELINDDIYYVNGDPIEVKSSPLELVTRRALDSRGMPAPLSVSRSVGGLSNMGFASNEPSINRINKPSTSRNSYHANPLTQSVSCKSFRKNITKAELANGRLRLCGNYPLCLNEITATVPKVMSKISSDIMNGAAIVLLDSMFFQITDTSITRGAGFWKGSRRIYFTTEEEYEQYRIIQDGIDSNSKVGPKKKFKRKTCSESSEDSNDGSDISYSPINVNSMSPVATRTNTKINSNFDNLIAKFESIENKLLKIDDLTNDVKLISNIIKVNECGSIVNSIKTTFQCIICLNLSKDDHPSVLYCCQAVACAECLMRWKTEKNECPHCRRVNPIQIPVQLRGITDLFSELRKIDVNESFRASVDEELPDIPISL